jgi:hypothetical protein
VGAGYPEPLNFAGRFARFAVSFIGFILALFVGLWRLTEWPSAQRRVVPRPATTPQAAMPAMPGTPTQAGPASPWAPPPSHTPAPAMAATAPGVSPWAPPSHTPPAPPLGGEGAEGARGESNPPVSPASG